MCYNYSRRGGGSLLFLIFLRGVAQLGSALGSGPRGRRFESCRSDQQRGVPIGAFFFCFFASTNLVIARAFRRTTRQAPERDSSKGNGSGIQKRKKKQTSLISRRAGNGCAVRGVKGRVKGPNRTCRRREKKKKRTDPISRRAGNGCDRKKRKGAMRSPKALQRTFYSPFRRPLRAFALCAEILHVGTEKKVLGAARGGGAQRMLFSAVVNGGRGNTGKPRKSKG